MWARRPKPAPERTDKLALAPLFREFGGQSTHRKVESEAHEEQCRAWTMRHSLQPRFTLSPCIPEVCRSESGICLLFSMACGPMKPAAVALADRELREMTRRFCAARSGDPGRSLRERSTGALPSGTLIGARATVPWESSTHQPRRYASVDDRGFFRRHRCSQSVPAPIKNHHV